MTDLIIAILILTGSFLMLLAGIGINRMPDLLTRMHATTKAGALGVGLMVVAFAVVNWGDMAFVVRALAVVVFVILTAPIAAHVLARASYFVGVPQWDGVVKDVIKERYDLETHELASRHLPVKEAEPAGKENDNKN
ncbi:monovalent cation/H(+) antiporter subunit G [Vibrio metschnikovii]|uniref:Monovalent cation/H(+) antiporter subunit G n=6 Tax=Unclassified Bacteria TaxID=49928 RepID=A0AAU6T0G7_UNCXX|nr:MULTISPECIES: monovalent cation/H(+) antiporter subunit G [Vibrio]EKO3555913.1 monovalent cation/H(+) antiporter subunit G [Vibrio metschnikovii]EKO3568088.1 monovalent cation/H(+) antiporter subunit G [Vibrio metschnikovii]EKO3571143.1 monovalent cation/H(+) antiporter subunit G [Vibrio metschnikovii]EKO3574237.1 monovalent cation/H(+) antiporter subunit G [Vibrio metschnikovii]EKO3584687.1 monovalent cation/H(+) antiporter subunit G [Vibrio metschnikovii]